MNSYSRVYAAIDLDAVESNMRAMKDSLPPTTSMIGVVKTDGYGHGAVPVAEPLILMWKGMRWPPLTRRLFCAATASRK
mgnify:CR=1 FL=1